MSELEKSSTHKNLQALQAELVEISTRGYALDIDEHTDSISAVGIAFESDGVVYAISIPAPTSRFIAKQIFLIEKLKEIKSKIS